MKRIHLKPETATKGFFYLDHVPTGKVFTGTSENMQSTITAIRESLIDESCKHKRLVRLYHVEPDFTAKIFPTKSIKEARKLEATFRSERPGFLLIN